MNVRIKGSEGNKTTDRLLVLSRIMAAVFGGYALTTVMILLFSYLLPLPKKDALMLATMLGYIIYALIIIWAFTVSRVKLVWLGIGASTGLCGAFVFLLHNLQSIGT